MAFCCQSCGSQQFTLQVQPQLANQLTVSHNTFNEVVIRLGEQPQFVADLGFMNRFASCQHCGALKQWQYLPQAANPTPSTPVL
jgi:hypothetical protein